MQHAFNELLQKVREKENEKNLSCAAFAISERKGNKHQDFLKKAEGQLKELKKVLLSQTANHR